MNLRTALTAIATAALVTVTGISLEGCQGSTPSRATAVTISASPAARATTVAPSTRPSEAAHLGHRKPNKDELAELADAKSEPGGTDCHLEWDGTSKGTDQWYEAICAPAPVKHHR